MRVVTSGESEAHRAVQMLQVDATTTSVSQLIKYDASAATHR